MKLSYAIKVIQQSVKSELNLNIIPVSASAERLKEKLGIEFDKAKCDLIAQDLITDYKKNNSAIAKQENKIMTQDNEQSDLFVTNNLEESPPESNALVFGNNFEKASLVKSELAKTDLILSDTESLDIAQNMKDVFESMDAMILSATTIYRNNIIAKKTQTRDSIVKNLDDIEQIETAFDSEAMRLVHAHGAKMKTYRIEHVDKAKKIIESALGVTL
jgi:hypothetical protein